MSGWSRGPVHGVLALVVALTAAWVLLAQATDRRRPARPLPSTAEAVWRHARRADVPGVLPDGALYQPAYFLDGRVSVGTASDPGAGEVRLVVWAADGAVRVLRRLRIATAPQYAGFSRAGGQLVWAESVTGADGSARTELWRGRPVPHLKVSRLVRAAEAAVSVYYRGGVLWWSTGTGGRTVWHMLDLRTV